ncbi:hypothetical protein ACSBR1_002800 [Camellia fascicularis]
MDKENTHRQSSEPEENNEEREVTTEREDGQKETKETDARKEEHFHPSAREILVSIRFNEPGWQWSGCFLPDHLGDTQVKMWNHVSGAVSMIHVEVQNANVSIRDEKIVGSLHGNSGTNLIM